MTLYLGREREMCAQMLIYICAFVYTHRPAFLDFGRCFTKKKI